MMLRKMTLTLCLVACCVWCLALVARGDNGKSAGSPVSFKPVASLYSLMEGQDMHFSALGVLIDQPDAKNRTKRLIVEAELLAELAHVNTLTRNKEDYRAWASEVRDLSLDLARLASKRDSNGQEEMRLLYRKINKTCLKCHDRYQ